MTVATDRTLEERLEAALQELELLRESAAQDAPALPPCNLDSNEPQMETNLHLRQMILLITCLEWVWRVGGATERTNYFAAGNLTIYYSDKQVKNQDFRGPDFFVVKDVDDRPRRSWTLWEEDGRYPDVVVEILSDSTAQVDLTTKKDIYQNTFRTPEYFWFDPVSLEFQGFCLVKKVYQAIAPNPQGWLWSDELGLFLGVHDRQLRYFTAEGELVPTPQESAVLEAEQRHLAQERAEQATQQAEQATQRAERLAAKLRELNVDPDEID
jgi:Uma2 family endonuclease